jgi:hypothetical protein
MTLVIARRFSERIVVVSDTMTSGEHFSKQNIVPGRLKSVVIGDHLSISYAGLADKALEIIRKAQQLFRETKCVDQILSFLSEHSRNGCDFILASHVVTPAMYKISNGTISKDADVFWIGNSDPIKSIRRIEDATPDQDEPADHFPSGREERRFLSAINRFSLQSGVEWGKDVGGFLIVQLCSPVGYCYVGHAGVAINDGCRVPGGWTKQQLEDQASGMTKFAYNVMGSRYRGVAVVGVFLPDVKVGYVYAPTVDWQVETVSAATLKLMTIKIDSRAQLSGGWIEADDSRNRRRRATTRS